MLSKISLAFKDNNRVMRNLSLLFSISLILLWIVERWRWPVTLVTSHSSYQSLVTLSLIILCNVEGLRWPVTLITLSHKWSQIVSLVTHGPKWSHWFVSRLMHNLVGWDWSQRMTSHSSYSESEVVTNCHNNHKWSHWSVSKTQKIVVCWGRRRKTTYRPAPPQVKSMKVKILAQDC